MCSLDQATAWHYGPTKEPRMAKAETVIGKGPGASLEGAGESFAASDILPRISPILIYSLPLHIGLILGHRNYLLSSSNYLRLLAPLCTSPETNQAKGLISVQETKIIPAELSSTVESK